MDPERSGRQALAGWMFVALASCGGDSSPEVTHRRVPPPVPGVQLSVDPNPILGVLGPDPVRIVPAGDREYRWTVVLTETSGLGRSVVFLSYRPVIAGAPPSEYFASNFPRRLEGFGSLSVPDSITVSSGYRLDSLIVSVQLLDDLANRMEISITVPATDAR